MRSILKSVLLVACSGGLAFGQVDQEKYAHITQDRIQLAIDQSKPYARGVSTAGSSSFSMVYEAERLTFNDRVIRPDELSAKLKKSYSVDLEVMTEDPLESLTPITQVIEAIKTVGLKHQLVRIKIYVALSSSSENCEKILIQSDGSILLNDKTVSLAQLRSQLSTERPLSIFCINKLPDYVHLLNVLEIVEGYPVRRIEIDDRNAFISVKAKLYTLGKDGAKDVLSSPSAGTRAGSECIVGVLSSQQALSKNFHQTEVGGGSQFSILPQIIGEFRRVSGVFILTKSTDEQVAFREGDIPVYSYCSSKTVIPFSVVFPPDVESLDIPLASVDGNKTASRLSITVEETGR